jgi:hypothetical protein
MNGSNENNPSGNRKDFRILSLDGGGICGVFRPRFWRSLKSILNTRSGDIST